MAERLMLSGWAWHDLCKEQAGALLSCPETMSSGQHGSGLVSVGWEAGKRGT